MPERVPCTVGGEPADVLLWRADYDDADGQEASVGGSQVERKV
jgi:hypothetical protein